MNLLARSPTVRIVGKELAHHFFEKLMRKDKW